MSLESQDNVAGKFSNEIDAVEANVDSEQVVFGKTASFHTKIFQ